MRFSTLSILLVPCCSAQDRGVRSKGRMHVLCLHASATPELVRRRHHITRGMCGVDSLRRHAGTAQDLNPGVVELSTDAEYEAAMKDVADKDARAVVDFTATWCGPCEWTGPWPACHAPCLRG